MEASPATEFSADYLRGTGLPRGAARNRYQQPLSWSGDSSSWSPTVRSSIVNRLAPAPQPHRSTTSTFEILGPIMVGPSSSHTAGALRCAQVAASLMEAPVVRVRFVLHNSFAHTYRGHGTDRALVAGILGLATDDERIRDALARAVASLEFPRR